MEGIRAKEIISELGISERIEDEMTGVDRMTWSMLNFNVNKNVLEQALRDAKIHIDENANSYKQEKIRFASISDRVKKLLGPNASNSTFAELFDSAAKMNNILSKVIMYLATQLDKQMIALENQNHLLNDAIDSGYLSKEYEMKLKEITAYTTNMTTLSERFSKQFFDMLTGYSGVIAETIKKSQANSTSGEVLRKMQDLEMQLRNVKEQLSMRDDRRQQENIIPLVSQENHKTISKWELKRELKRLIEEDGILDLNEAADKLSEFSGKKIKTSILNAMGFRQMIKKAMEEVNSPDENENIKQDGEGTVVLAEKDESTESTDEDAEVDDDIDDDDNEDGIDASQV